MDWKILNCKKEIEQTLKGLKEAEMHLGNAEGFLVDAGYFSAENVKQCETAEVVPYISDHRERHNRTWDERFKIPPPRLRAPAFAVHKMPMP